MVKARKCNRGFNCGRSCISRTFNCYSNVDANGKELVENFTQYILRLSQIAPMTPRQIKKKKREEGKAPVVIPQRKKTPDHNDVIAIGMEEAKKFIDPEAVNAANLERERKAFLKNVEDARQTILMEIEFLEQRKEQQLNAGDRSNAMRQEFRIKKLKKELKDFEPATRKEFFDETDKLLNSLVVLNEKRQAGEIDDKNYVKTVEEINKKLTEQEVFQFDTPTKAEFGELRSSLLKNDNITKQQVFENTDFDPRGIEESRQRGIANALVEVSKMTNTLPRKGFKIFKDSLKDRAYAQHGLSNDNLGQMRDAIEASGNESLQNKLNISSKYYRESNQIQPGINMGVEEFQSDPAVMYHEYGHHIEFGNRDFAITNWEWVQSRATGPHDSLNNLTKGNSYAESERAYPDDFIAMYVGKRYSPSDIVPMTEVFSMGIQMFNNPSSMRQLYLSDPEHFFLTLGTLKILRGEA